ncbi:hypothetical protein [Flavobacterium terrae]|uniref:Uncharacterized protein n=1 Tax=Flavobacterium terrae TaxID=415425 RepID=A0A1M6AI26_9FLAO|nr:hypothetical protein [Flavobacterium terrae]SHI36136.1 hypothetical protein SAMN05444363_0227 [Flavobacterium terrae]
MKTINTSKISSVNSIMLFLASFGISYSLVSEFAFERPNRELLVIIICLLAGSFASKKREKAENNK